MSLGRVVSARLGCGSGRRRFSELVALQAVVFPREQFLRLLFPMWVTFVLCLVIPTSSLADSPSLKPEHPVVPVQDADGVGAGGLSEDRAVTRLDAASGGALKAVSGASTSLAAHGSALRPQLLSKELSAGEVSLEEPGTRGIAPSLRIVVRTIQAQGRIDEQVHSDKPIPIRIDSRLSDLADKLRKLPFRGFVFMSGDERVVSIRKKSVVPLVNGQTLALRPLYVDRDKVGLWIHWKDRSGAEILDTRMHLDLGQSMIAGTDLVNDPSSGLVLAVEVTPQ